MISYSYDNNGKYSGVYNCQLDQVATKRENRPIYLLPANSTWTPPPEYDKETEIPVWDGTIWRIQELPQAPPEPEPEPPAPTLDERVTALETEKANQTDVDELNEALNMILTGYTGEEGTDEAGTEG